MLFRSRLIQYVDTSALVAAVGGDAMARGALAAQRSVSSALLQVEAARALRGAAPEVRARAEELVATIDLIDIDRGIVAKAAQLAPEVRLRSLDAIHLATALAVPEPVAMLTLDQRLLAASLLVGVRPAL